MNTPLPIIALLRRSIAKVTINSFLNVILVIYYYFCLRYRDVYIDLLTP